MSAFARCLPAACPGCAAIIVARYSQYRGARPHFLFKPLLIAGVVAIVLMSLVFFWGAFALTLELAGNRPIQGKSFVVISFLLFLLTTPVILGFSWLWWRGIHRFPRKFVHECETCRWTGPCRVFEITYE